MSERDRIIREAERKASEIIEEARRRADGIIREAEAKWRAKAESERRRIIEEAERKASMIIADAKSRSNLLLVKAKEEVINKVFEEALELIKREEYNVKESLKNLLEEALAYIDKPSRIIVKSNHVKYMKEILSELGLDNVEVVPRDDILGGLIVESETGLVVDNRLETRLEQAKQKLIDKIARILWG